MCNYKIWTYSKKVNTSCFKSWNYSCQVLQGKHAQKLSRKEYRQSSKQHKNCIISQAKNKTLGGHFGNADLKSGKDVTPGHVSSFGVPKTLCVKTTLNRMFSSHWVEITRNSRVAGQTLKSENKLSMVSKL